eukprot:11196671-Lingulodinium_polyedra.AAC.1
MPKLLRNLLPPTRQSQTISRKCAGSSGHHAGPSILNVLGHKLPQQYLRMISTTKPRASAH